MPLAEVTTRRTLHAWRTACGLRPEDLASRAGVSIATVRNLEQGATFPRLRTAQALADVLHVGVDDIEWLEPTNKPPSRRKPRGR